MVAPINKMIDTVPFNVLTYSLDWHPANHLSFSDNVALRKFHQTSKVNCTGESHCVCVHISVFNRGFVVDIIMEALPI